MTEGTEGCSDVDDSDENESGIQLTRAQRTRITRALKTLNAVRQELEDANPNHNITWFLDAGDNLMLMARPHDVTDQDMRFTVHEGEARCLQRWGLVDPRVRALL